MYKRKQKIVVVGAGGFVGGWVCEELTTHPEIDVVGCVRNWSSATRIGRRGIAVVQSDARDERKLDEIFRDVDCVVNAAMFAPRDEYEYVTRMYDACAANKGRRFIHFSSAAVYGDRSSFVTERDPAMPNDEYGRGKLKTESCLLERSSADHPLLIILRPSIIYGPFSDAWTIRWARRIKQKDRGPCGALATGRCNLIHAQDLARAAVAAATTDLGGNRYIWNVNGPDPVSWNEYIARFGKELLGHPPRRSNFLKSILGVILGETIRAGSRRLMQEQKVGIKKAADSGLIFARIYKFAKDVVYLNPSWSEVKLMRRDVTYVGDRIAEDIGFKSAITLDEGLRNSASWCRIHGVIE